MDAWTQLEHVARYLSRSWDRCDILAGKIVVQKMREVLYQETPVLWIN